MVKELLLILAGCILFAVFEAVIILRRKECVCQNSVVFVPVTKNTDNLEYIIRELLYKIMQSCICVTIIICDYGADRETLEICKRMIRENSNFYLVKPEDVEKVIAKLK
jgi:hypothetical protein